MPGGEKQRELAADAMAKDDNAANGNGKGQGGKIGYGGSGSAGSVDAKRPPLFNIEFQMKIPGSSDADNQQLGQAARDAATRYSYIQE